MDVIGTTCENDNDNDDDDNNNNNNSYNNSLFEYKQIKEQQKCSIHSYGMYRKKNTIKNRSQIIQSIY